MADEVQPLKTGDPVPTECTPVDHLPTAALQAADTNPNQPGDEIAEAVGENAVIVDEDATVEGDTKPLKKGMLFLASRREKYIQAFAELDLSVCPTVAHDAPGGERSFASALDVLRLSLGPRTGVAVILAGFDPALHNSLTPPHDYSLREFYQVAMSALIQNVGNGKTKIVVIGTEAAVALNHMDLLDGLLPDGWQKTFAVDDSSLPFTSDMTAYFSGTYSGHVGIPGASLDDTAILCVHEHVITYTTRLPMLNALLTTNADRIKAFIQAGGCLVSWAQASLAYSGGVPIEYADFYDNAPTVIGYDWLRTLLPGIVPRIAFEKPPGDLDVTEDAADLLPDLTTAMLTTDHIWHNGFTGDYHGLKAVVKGGLLPAAGGLGLTGVTRYPVLAGRPTWDD